MTVALCSKVLSESAGRALGGVIHKFKEMKNVGFSTFNKMYDCAVTSVSDYASEIWGFKNVSVSDQIHNRAIRYF